MFNETNQTITNIDERILPEKGFISLYHLADYMHRRNDDKFIEYLIKEFENHKIPILRTSANNKFSWLVRLEDIKSING